MIHLNEEEESTVGGKLLSMAKKRDEEKNTEVGMVEKERKAGTKSLH